jgi:DNA-binding transcriptional LysR family regulator
LDEATSLVSAMDKEPRGVVRMTAADLGTQILPQIVRDFVTRFPGIRIELSLTARVVDLIEEGFDLALRSGRLRSSSLIARRIGKQNSGLYASSEYLQRRGRPRTVLELPDHDCIVIRRPEATEGSGSTWSLYRGEHRQSVSVGGPLSVDDLMAAWEAVRLGLGIGLIPTFGSFTTGLIRVLPKYSSLPVPISLVWPSRRLEPARVVIFREFLLAALSRAI